ncbi:uncharacterized protein [Rhodnius prolixus]|uniref:uncharacterized protein n=1 Tax=Rhodnius prolixus TaxID=13249 RepID=UPI003D18BC6D
MVVRSDGGKQFDSREFRRFAEEWSFEHRCSSPTNAQSNGMVERHIQTIKKMMKKASEDKKEMELCLLEYRNTPISEELPSPAEILFGRKVRGLLPYNPINRNFEEIREALKKRHEMQKVYYNRGKKELPMLQEGEEVMVQREGRWEPGKVKGNHGDRKKSYDVKMNKGGELWRNRRFIRKVKKPEKYKDYDCS